MSRPSIERAAELAMQLNAQLIRDHAMGKHAERPRVDCETCWTTVYLEPRNDENR